MSSAASPKSSPKPAQVLVIDFDAEKGGITLQ